MARTTVTLTPSTVENLPNELAPTSTVDWQNLEGGLSEDDNWAFALLHSEESPEANYTNFLYFRNFGFDLPRFSKVEGFEVEVKKRGTGTFEDYYVALAYIENSNIVITDTGRQHVGVWNPEITFDTYGSDTDNWNYSGWDDEKINSEQFGFVLSGQGTEELDSGEIDSISISLTYHLEYSHTASAGGKLSGTATQTVVVNSLIPTSGSKAAGSGLISHEVTASGGLSAAGDSTIISFISTDNGLRGSGTATVQVRYSTAFIAGAGLAGNAFPATAWFQTGSGGARLGGIASNFSTFGATGGVRGGKTGVDVYWAFPKYQGKTAVLNGSAFIDPYIATGGIGASGAATVTCRWAEVASAGAKLAGLASSIVFWLPTGGVNAAGLSLITYRVTVSGGASLGGEALAKPYVEAGQGGSKLAGDADVWPYVTLGGIRGSGSATVTMTFNANSQPNQWHFVCRGENNVPPDVIHPSAYAEATIRINTSTNRLSWIIHHNLTLNDDTINPNSLRILVDPGISLDLVQLRGPASLTQTGAIQIAIDDLQSIATTPITGSAIINSTQRTQVQNGQWYLYLFQNSNTTKIRGQIDNYAGVLAGTATVTTSYAQTIVAAGISLSGQNGNTQLHSNMAVGGVIARPENTQSEVQIFAKGGVALGNSSTVMVARNLSTSGGSLTNGVSQIATTYEILTSAGTSVDGQALRSITPALDLAGISCGGIGLDGKIFVPIISGGIAISGEHLKQMTYNSLIVTGGVRLASRSAIERIKNFTTTRRGYGAAMASSNILSVPKDTSTKLLDPINAQSPPLNKNRYRMRHVSGWCDFGEPCKKAFLPKIVKNRQGKYLPSKEGGDITDTLEELTTGT
jgi:hypothetical protein